MAIKVDWSEKNCGYHRDQTSGPQGQPCERIKFSK
jgi:hypothetical protein